MKSKSYRVCGGMYFAYVTFVHYSVRCDDEMKTRLVGFRIIRTIKI